GGLDVAQHAATKQRNVAPAVARHINDDLYAVQRGREATDDDAPGGFIKEIVEGRDDGALGLCAPWPLGIRRIGKERQHAFVAILIEPIEVHGWADDRRVVYFEITRMNDDADRCRDGDRRTRREAVRDVY